MSRRVEILAPVVLLGLALLGMAAILCSTRGTNSPG